MSTVLSIEHLMMMMMLGEFVNLLLFIFLIFLVFMTMKVNFGKADIWTQGIVHIWHTYKNNDVEKQK